MREAPRATFGGRVPVKLVLGTNHPTVAKAAFAREKAGFAEQFADDRRRTVDRTLGPTPRAALVHR